MKGQVRRLLTGGSLLILMGMSGVAVAQTTATQPGGSSGAGASGAGGTATAPVATSAATPQQTPVDGPNGYGGEIIVTAQKRAQSINDVGLTIQAASQEQLAARGISNVADLVKLVPGFTFTNSIYSTPVYTLRGIGLYDATFSAPPSVSVYTDQIPRNVPVMTDGLDFDIERVEVLKGPQGTLFGQSSTGGAINYILAKPTDEFHAGGGVSYERFGRFDGSAYVSGALTETLKVRAAVRAVQGGDWQYSISRPNDHNGATRLLEGRLTVDWHPVDRLKVEVTATGVRDHSDVQAPQYVGTVFNVYSAASLAAANASPATRNPYGHVDNALYASITTPGSANYDPTFLGRQQTLANRLNGSNAAAAAGAQAILGTPGSYGNARRAEWTPGLLGPSHNNYYQVAAREDYRLTDTITFTAISALARKHLDYAQDLDATTAQAVDVPLFGTVRSFNQEVRLSGNSSRLNWIVGGTYDNLRSTQNNFYELTDYSGNSPVPGLTPISLTLNQFTSRLHSYAAFGNAEYKLTHNLTVMGGVRYTRNNQSASYCYNDPASDTGQGAAGIFSLFNTLFTGTTYPAILPGQCFPLGDGLQGTTFGRSTLSPVNRKLDQHNVSYRVGLNYKFDQGTLLYATVSQGYKAGIFSAIGASSTSQYASATQEKVIAYEAGFKAPLLDRRVNFNGAFFYYDYTNKQVRGRIADAIYGLLEKLINVPKSYVWGLEGELSARPLDGVTLALGGTYLKSRVNKTFTQTPDGSAVYNAQGYTGDFKGSPLPFTPKFSGNADAQYQWAMGTGLNPFVGGSVVYQGSENTTFYNNTLLAPDFHIKGYATVDVRAGIAGPDNRWRLTLYGRNVLNKYYTTSITTYLDTLFRFTGRPATYGASFSVNL